jgi:phage shock protein A
MNYKKKNYEENLTDYNEQFNRYENMKKLYEADENKFNEKLKQFQDTITTLSSDILKLKDSLVNRNEELVLKDILFKRENEICVKLYLNQMKLNQAVENKEKHYNDIQNLEVNIKKLESEIMTIDLRIPNLEEEKKSYIAKKQFKDAGRVTNELVTLNKTKSMNIETIVFNKEKIENMRMNIENV